MSIKEYIPIAVGVINHNNKILISKRHVNVHQGGKWEFPGGKIENNETDSDALTRELYEELDIKPIDIKPLITIPYHYEHPDKSVKVLLKVYTVESFSGEAKGKEGQEVKWVRHEQLAEYQFPKANQAIIRAIQLPSVYFISQNFQQASLQKQFSQINKHHNLTHTKINKLIQCRTLVDDNSFAELEQLLSQEKTNNYQLQINSKLYFQLCERDEKRLRELIQDASVQIGIHLTSHDLNQYESLKISGFSGYLSASCHNEEDIVRANQIALDFIVLSPVNKTQSHPEAKPLGWEQFSHLCYAAQMPVYALGGMETSDTQTAINYGAQGIAGISLIYQ